MRFRQNRSLPATSRKKATRKSRKNGYGRRLRLESLEDRRVLALVGVAPVDTPIIGYDSGGTVSYDSASDMLSVSATPLSIDTGSSTGFFFSGDLDINIEVDGAGALVGGVPGDDLVLTGNVDVDGDFIVDFSGTLLTGEVVAFGSEDSGGNIDLYDFRFVVTGGALAGLYAGKDLGVTTTSENSSFTGDFSVDFGGDAKGEIGAIDQPEEPGIDIEKFVKIMRNDCPPEGLTPGFWKTHSHYGPAPSKGWAATGYDPDDSYEAIFAVNVAPGDVSLLEALGSNGGGVKALMRHSAAALLNAAHPNINYAYSVSQVISLTQAAINSGNANQIEQLKNDFDHQNNKGADLSDCDCEPTMIGPKDADTPPGLIAEVGDQVMYLYTVTNTGDVALNIDSLIDDNGTPGNPADDFTPAAVDANNDGFNDGDVDGNGVLDPGESWQFQTDFSTITDCGTVGNTAVVTASSVITGAEVMDSDPAYFTAIGKDHHHGGHHGHDKCDDRDKHDRDKDRCDDRDRHDRDKDRCDDKGKDKHEDMDKDRRDDRDKHDHKDRDKGKDKHDDRDKGKDKHDDRDKGKDKHDDKDKGKDKDRDKGRDNDKSKDKHDSKGNSKSVLTSKLVDLVMSKLFR